MSFNKYYSDEEEGSELFDAEDGHPPESDYEE